jgi:hypothetical protein
LTCVENVPHDKNTAMGLLRLSRWGWEMAVYRLLREGPAFEPEAVHALVIAYEDVLRELQLTDRNDPFTDIVAKAVIEVARLGERDPAEIRNRVLKVLTKPEEPGAA